MLVGMVVGRSDLAARTTAVALVWAGAVLAVLGYTLGAIIAQVFGFDSSGGPPLRAADGVRMTLEGDYLERLAASGWPHGIPVAAWGVEPHSGGTFEIIGSGGFALAVLGLSLLLAGPLCVVLLPVAALGTMPLTSYSVHVLSYAVLIGPIGLATELQGGGPLDGNLLWVVSVVALLIACTLWALVVGRGPLECATAWAARRTEQPAG